MLRSLNIAILSVLIMHFGLIKTACHQGCGVAGEISDFSKISNSRLRLQPFQNF